LKNQHGSVERWNKQNGNIYHNRYIVNDDGAQTLDYFEMTYTEDAEGTYFQSFGGDYRMSDILLAHRLISSELDVKHSGAKTYQGRVHDILTFEVAPDSPTISLYVARDTGLIHRLSMELGLGNVNIIFASHTPTRGITHAQENRTFIGDQIVEYEYGLTVKTNKSVSRHMKREGNLKADPSRVDMSAMTVDTLAPGVFHVGQGDYALFVEHEGRYIAVNAYGGLKDRYDALVKQTGRSLPLSSIIVTHHHSDHMDSVQEAKDMGATLLVTPETEKMLQADAGQNGELPRLRVLKDEDIIGPLKVYIRSTCHSVDNAFVYHSGSKVLFQDDHYNGLFEDGPTWVRPSGVMLHAMITDLELDVETILSGHARKAEAWDVFTEGVQKTSVTDACPSRRNICKGQ